jgi:hypothetical protein
MGSFSDYMENQIINHMLRNQAYTPPSTLYVALYTVSPSDAGGGTEVSGGSYARQTVTFSVASSGSTSNSADITYPQATADWGTIVAIGVLDASTGGNLIAWGALTANKTVNNGDQFKIPAGNLTLTVD